MKNKFKKLAGLLLAAVMALAALPIQTLASEWGKGDTVYAAMLGDYVGSDGKSYGDKRNYTFMYYKSDGSEGTSTRYASTHAKLGISKNGITQQAICIEAGVAYNTGSSYVGEDNSNTYLRNLPWEVQQSLKYALLCGFNSDTKSSPVSGTNLDDFSFATQIIVWEIQQQLRTGYSKGDLSANKWGTPAKVYYEQLQGRPAEKCYEYILGKMKAYSVVPSFTGRAKITAPTHTLKYNSSMKKYSITLVDENNSGMPASAFNISGVTVTKSGNKYTFSTTTKISGTKACTYKANRTSGDQLVIWKSGNGSQTMAAGIDDPVQFYANFKTSNLGTAQIKKVWNHKNDSSSTQASNSDIYFTIKNSSGSAVKATGKAGSYTYSTSGSVSQFKLNSSNTFLVKSLPTGTYTVTEHGNNSDGSIPYYTRTGGVSKTVTVTAGSTGTVTFTNTRNTGTGEVIKTWVDTNGNAIEASNCISNNQQIYFRIKNADGKYITVSGTKYSGTYSFTGTTTTATSLYVNPGTGTFTVSDLPTGKYTVYEYGSPEGYSVNKASQTITISANKTASVSFVNSQDSGTANIKKIWLSDATLTATQIANLEKNVTFTVKNADGKYIKVTGSAGAYVYAGTQTSANSMKLSGSKFNVSKLPMGTYTVTEINNASGYTPKSQTKTVTIANKGETKSVSFTNKSTPVVVIRKHFSDEDNLTAAQLKAQYAKVTVNLQVLGFNGKEQTTPSTGNYVEFTGTKGNYTFKGISATKTSAADLKLNDNGEMTISFGTNIIPYYLSVIENYSGTDYEIDSRDQRIDLGNGDPSAVIDLDDIELDNQLKTGSVEVNKQFLDIDGSSIKIPDDKLAEVAFKIKHNGKYLTFTGSNGSYTYKGENNTGTELKLNKATYNFIANELPAREEYTVYEVSGTTGYSFSIDPVTFTITPAGSVKKVFTNKAMTGTISIVKHSADGVLSGWQFRVYGTALTGQTYDKTFTTDTLGNITVPDLRIGNYTVEEVAKGIVGYITPESQNVVVEYNKTSTLEFTNIPIGNIHVTKVDKDYPNNKLTGAEFTVYETDGITEVDKLTEISTGEYQLDDLQYGDYLLKETKAPENYVLDEEYYEFSIRTADETVNVETNAGKGFENDAMTGTIIISKHSADGKLSGWKFRVYGTALTGQKYDKTFTTDTNGKITVADLRIGNYTVEEVTTGIVGYITPDSQNVTVEYNKTATLEFTNVPIGNVHVTKIDKDYPDNKLTGAEFTVYKTDKITVVGKLTEISTSEYQLNDLQYGDYFLKETKAPKNYILDNNFYAFSITEAGATVNVETTAGKGFENNVMTGSISIIKHSADGKLNGWKFRVTGTAQTGQKYDKTFSTDTNGKIMIADLRIGDYKVEEVTTGVVGYITPDSQNVTVEYNKTATLEFTNVPIGNVHVTKIDKDYPDNKLTGAEFTVYKTDKITVVGKLTEISTSEYQLNDLQYGDYFLKETKAPKNYILDNNFYAFSITEAGATVNVETNVGKGFENDAMTGTINISKHSADGKLGGWKFRVYGTALTGQKYDKTFSTDTNGKITVADLRIGNYSVEEVTTGIVGYITPSSQNVTVEYNKTATLDFTNIPIGKIVLNKVDADNTNKYISGSVYAVYKDVNGNGTYEKDIDTFVKNLTDNNGIYSLDEVPYGKYLVKEISAPTGYLVDENYYPANIDSANAEKTVSNTDDGKTFVEQPVRGAVQITKVDEEYIDNKLSGAEFTIYAEDKKTEIGKMTEVEKGIYRYESLRYGKYYLKETKAPDYFIQDVNFYYFEITENGKTVIVTNDELGKGTFINAPQKGEIKIVKTSYDNKVEGFSFEVTGKTYTGQTFKKTYTTDKNGIIRINDLRAGEYNIHEVADDASAGYLLPEDKQLTIDRDGAKLVAEMHNSKLPDNPPTGASNDGFTQTAVIIISMVMMSAAVVLVFPLSKRKRKR